MADVNEIWAEAQREERREKIKLHPVYAAMFIACLVLVLFLICALSGKDRIYRQLEGEKDTLWTMYTALQADYVEEVQKNTELTDEHTDLLHVYTKLYDKVDELTEANVTLSDQHLLALNQLETAHEQLLTGRYTALPYSREDIETAVATVIAEAGGEPYDGQQAVAQCIRDRYLSGDFGNTIKEICLAKDQFAPPYDGNIMDYPSCFKAVIEVFYWDVDVFEEPVLYFYNPNHSEPEMVKWLETRTYLGQICCHIFRGGPYV